VAAYRRPDFRVDVNLAGAPNIAGTALDGTITARYLFGAPMKEAEGWKYLTTKDPEKIVGGRPAQDGTNRVVVRGNYVMWLPRIEHQRYLAEKHAVADRSNAEARKKGEVVQTIDGERKE